MFTFPGCQGLAGTTRLRVSPPAGDRPVKGHLCSPLDTTRPIRAPPDPTGEGFRTGVQSGLEIVAASPPPRRSCRRVGPGARKQASLCLLGRNSYPPVAEERGTDSTTQPRTCCRVGRPWPQDQGVWSSRLVLGKHRPASRGTELRTGYIPPTSFRHVRYFTSQVAGANPRRVGQPVPATWGVPRRVALHVSPAMIPGVARGLPVPLISVRRWPWGMRGRGTCAWRCLIRWDIAEDIYYRGATQREDDAA
ncbi:hypothetical protein JHW43_005818 [Diplocarpon mali]|nr:hypothetical protein JHW43_005818 [Diplocarpon mali]